MDQVQIKAVGEGAALVQFAEHLDDKANARVLALDSAIMSAPFEGLLETVPAYVSLLVRFDPLRVNWSDVEQRIKYHATAPVPAAKPATTHIIPVCYDPTVAADVVEVGARLGLGAGEVARLHTAATFKVYMYGFAPGYAYMGGVPEALQLSRKPQAVRGIPPGSVIIAGAQCLITTLAMPTGWWVIGRTPLRVLDIGRERPFLFNPGDCVRFEAISASQLSGEVVQ